MRSTNFSSQIITAILGLLFLQLSANAAKHINKGIDRLVRVAQRDGNNHDMSCRPEAGIAGFTIHTNSLPEVTARDRLVAHCKMRKYDTKSDAWYGLLLDPGSGAIKGALVLEEDWVADPSMDKVLEAWPRKPVTSLAEADAVWRT